METKIKQYVNYQFRFKSDVETEDLKAEIIANLIDRYHENLERGYDEEKAYVEAIKQMGDFSSEFKDKVSKEYSIKPHIVDVVLLCATVLAIFSTVLLLFSIVAGTILTAISIALYGSGAYYLYANAQYVKKENKDIEKHNILLSKIIKYLKTNFIFWAINISLIIANILSSLLTIVLLPSGILVHDPQSLLILVIIFFIIILIIAFIILFGIYSRILGKYKYMTGNVDPKSYLNDSYKFIKGRDTEKYIYSRKYLKLTGGKFVPVISLVMILLCIIPLTYRYTRHSNYDGLVNIIQQILDSFQFNIWPIGALLLIEIVGISVIAIISLIKKRNKSKRLIILLYVFFIPTLIIFTNQLDAVISYPNSSFYYLDYSSSALIFIFMVFIGIMLIIRLIVKLRLKKKESKVE